MAHVLEMVTALLGSLAVAAGSVCVLRFGGANECTPANERLSWALMVAGAVAVGGAFLAAAWVG